MIGNNGTEDQPWSATVVGTQEGSGEVYRETMDVQDDIGRRKTRVEFPAYQPSRPGLIVWTAAIDDDDPDLDEATAATWVKSRRPRRGHDDDHDDDGDD